MQIILWNFNILKSLPTILFLYITVWNYKTKPPTPSNRILGVWFFLSSVSFKRALITVNLKKLDCFYLIYLVNKFLRRWDSFYNIALNRIVKVSSFNTLQFNITRFYFLVAPFFNGFDIRLQAYTPHSFYKSLNTSLPKGLLSFTQRSIYNSGFFFKARLFWFSSVLIKFLEFLNGSKVFFFVNRSLIKFLTGKELLVCSLWNRRLFFFQRKVGFNLFIIESLYVFYLTLKVKDPTFFLNWFKIILSKINFWRHRSFLKYFRFLLLYVFNNFFMSLRVYGVRFKVKGKISVAGNARKRTFDIKAFKTSYSTLNTRVAYKKDVATTFTGVLGLKFMIFFS